MSVDDFLIVGRSGKFGVYFVNVFLCGGYGVVFFIGEVLEFWLDFGV